MKIEVACTTMAEEETSLPLASQRYIFNGYLAPLLTALVGS
jgi:hypothetical protein